jgi:uncharacterized SAM-binding protein YcdF (DUF218 family)
MVVGRLLRLVVRLIKVAVVIVLGCAVAALPLAGRFLMREDALDRADVIFVLAGGRAERWLEGVELYKTGYAPVIVLSPGFIDPLEEQLRGRGVQLPAEPEIARTAMVQLGVPDRAIERLDASVDNTAQEAARLHALAARRGWHRVIVVTSKLHSRRTRFAFRRELADSGITPIVRTSRYDRADPAHWWRQRADVRFVFSEIGKLMAYEFGLGE